MNVNRAPAPDVTHLAEAREVRRILGGISGERLRQIIRDHDDFPEHAMIGQQRVWHRPAVKAWQLARTRPHRRIVYVVVTQYGRNGGRLNAAARSAGVHATTARRILRDAGIPTPAEREA